MAFKFIVLFSILAAVNAGDLSHGYVSYAPTLEKTYQYAAPVAKTIEYAAPIAKTIEYAAPVTKTIYQPSQVYASKTVYEQEPIQYDNYHTKTLAYAPAPVHYHGHGTVSHHGKVIETPHSYVNKYDTRYISDEPQYKYAYPAIQSVVKTPIVSSYPSVVKTPIVPVVKSHYEPDYHHSYAHSAPVVKSHYEPDYHHSYAHAAPVLKTAAISYSPSTVVSHASFESSNGHYSW